jgi:hypothetical protein
MLESLVHWCQRVCGRKLVYVSMQLWTEPFLTGGKANDCEHEWMDPCSDDDLVCFVLGLAHASCAMAGRYGLCLFQLAELQQGNQPT